jgi:ATP-dependent HslUV protease, peptidase subunit HslV
MSTITVAKKGDFVSIAADTLTTFGSTKESAEYVSNSEKIIGFRDSYLGFSGSASAQIAVSHFLSKTKRKILLNNVLNIFQFGLDLQKEMKEKYFVKSYEDDASFETFQTSILIANENGIFGLTQYRYVQEFTKFSANGSGSEYALGAMFSVYNDESKTAEDIAKLGVTAGIEFDDGSGLPIDCYTIKLKK